MDGFCVPRNSADLPIAIPIPYNARFCQPEVRWTVCIF